MRYRYRIERKNHIFSQLVAMDRRCRMYRHSHGEIPAELQERLAELRQEYQTAIESLDMPIEL